jgi:hypothetical protein
MDGQSQTINSEEILAHGFSQMSSTQIFSCLQIKMNLSSISSSLTFYRKFVPAVCRHKPIWSIFPEGTIFVGPCHRRPIPPFPSRSFYIGSMRHVPIVPRYPCKKINILEDLIYSEGNWEHFVPKNCSWNALKKIKSSEISPKDVRDMGDSEFH